jgi:hypothetical protein
VSTQSYRAELLQDRVVYTSDGERLGKVEHVLADDLEEPQYLEVKSGWFGSKRHVVPIYGMTFVGEDITLPYTKEQLENAPTFAEEERIDYECERLLAGYYGHSVREWDDSRDRWLTGEDLSRGPTPETRHPIGWETGGVDDIRDTTQGPTPETRRTMRAASADPDAAAAGQPDSDLRTRGDVGGTQDWDGTGREPERIRLRRWMMHASAPRR